MPDLHFNGCNLAWISRPRGVLGGEIPAHLRRKSSADFIVPLFPWGPFPYMCNFPIEMPFAWGRAAVPGRAGAPPARTAPMETPWPLAREERSLPAAAVPSRPSPGTGRLVSRGGAPSEMRTLRTGFLPCFPCKLLPDLTQPAQGLALSVGFATRIPSGGGRGKHLCKNPSPAPSVNPHAFHQRSSQLGRYLILEFNFSSIEAGTSYYENILGPYSTV